MFTPEAERARPRLKPDLDDERATELASLYASMGLDTHASKLVGHTTQPAVPFRTSSSVLRNVALQDATAMLNALRQHRQQQSQQNDPFWSEQLLDRAAAQVSKTVSAMSPPAKDNSLDVGLRLARGGQGVRKAKSNFELARARTESLQKEDIPPQPRFHHDPPATSKSQPTTIRTSFQSAFERKVPPSIASMFSPPNEVTPAEHMRLEDDAFGYNPLDYEAQEDDDDMYAEVSAYGDEDSAASGSTPGTSPPEVTPRAASPPLLDERNVFADLGFGDADSLAEDDEIAAAERQAHEIGQRILASTIEYDDYSDDDSDEENMPIPTISVKSPSPPSKVKRVLSRTDSLIQAMNDPLPLPVALACTQRDSRPVAQVRAAKSTPVLRSAKSSRGPMRISPALPAPPALQTVSLVVCDSVGNDAEDLPPIPTVPTQQPSASSFGSFALRARKSLTALRASFWADEAPPPPPLLDDVPTGNPVLTPRVDWSMEGTHFAGWNSEKEEKKRKDDAPKSDDPFFEPRSESIDYTKSFFYKPNTPPRPDGAATPPRAARKRSSVKSLKAALLLPVALPPVPPIPVQYRKPTPGDRTPQRSPGRIVPPQLCILSPGAWEEGRPARPLVLEGAEWEGHDVVASWGGGIRRGKGKKKASKRSSRHSYTSDTSSPELSSSPLRHYGH